MIGKQFCTLFTRTSKNDWSILIKLCWNQKVTADIKNLCIRYTCANLCVGTNCSWSTVRCYSRVAVEALRCHYVRLVGQSHPSIHQHCSQYDSENDRELISFTLRRPSLVSSANSGCFLLGFGPYTCIKHWERSKNLNLNMHTLLIGISSSTQLASCGNVAVNAWFSILPD